MFDLSDASLPGGEGGSGSEDGGIAEYWWEDSQRGSCFLPLVSSNGQWVSLLCYRGERFRLEFAWDACGPAVLLFRGIDCTMTKREEMIQQRCQ